VVLRIGPSWGVNAHLHAHLALALPASTTAGFFARS
jgi:hypothetical protein